MVLLLISYLIVCLTPAFSQFLPAPTDLKNATGYAGIGVRYKEVPTGICELDPNIKSYAGYSDVAKDQHIFWWFFEARNEDPSKAPLVSRSLDLKLLYIDRQ